jgi:hypothetical protein
MAFSKAKASFPVVLFILISVLVSIMAINYYKVDMNINDGFMIGGMCGSKEESCECGCKNSKGGCKNSKGDSGRPFFLMEGMKNEDEKEEDFASISAFTKTLLN